jgi:hypothetical protein
MFRRTGIGKNGIEFIFDSYSSVSLSADKAILKKESKINPVRVFVKIGSPKYQFESIPSREAQFELNRTGTGASP